MVGTTEKETELFPQPTYLPRVTRYDGRAIEDALAGPSLFDRGVRLDGVVVEATYAVEDTPLLKRLRESGVRQLIDPQTLRLSGERFLSVAQFRQLPYDRETPISVESFAPSEATGLARAVMGFQQDAGASWYVAAGLPYHDRDFDGWLRHNDRLLDASCAANGGQDIDRKPLLAQVAPGRNTLANPQPIINRLKDYPISGAYVQPLRLDAVKDGVEKLVQYADFLRTLEQEGIPWSPGASERSVWRSARSASRRSTPGSDRPRRATSLRSTGSRASERSRVRPEAGDPGDASTWRN